MQRRPLRELRHDSSADMPEISGAALLTQRSCRSYRVRRVFERRHVTSPGIPPTDKGAGERIHPRLVAWCIIHYRAKRQINRSAKSLKSVAAPKRDGLRFPQQFSKTGESETPLLQAEL